MTAHQTLSPTDLRLAIRARGFHPVPVSGPAMNVPSAGKRPMMPKWEQRCLNASLEEIRRWGISEPACTNTGLLCGLLVGPDIDVLNPELAGAIEKLALDRLGPTPLRRIGRAPKVLLGYRVAVPVDKIQTKELFFTDDPREKGTKVEVLARGQQFVGFGTHPDTQQPYSWDDASPLTINFDELPATTEDALRQFVVEAEAILRAAGALTRAERKQEIRKRERENKTREAKGRKTAGFGLHETPDRETIAEALEHLPNDFDYDGWVQIGFALYDGLGEGGRDLWEWWSATSPKDDPGLTAKKWSSFAGGHSVKIGTLFWHALQHGWRSKGRSSAPTHNRAEREAGEEAEQDENDDRPTVFVVAGKTPEAADRAEALLLESGVCVYSRAGTLVRPITESVPASKGRMTQVARLSSLCTTSLSDIAARKIRFQKYDKREKDWININPPIELLSTLLKREGEWGWPPVSGVITTPTLRPDGSVLSRRGYDPETRLFLALDPSFHLPPLSEHPTKTDALAALLLLEALLSGFPFVTPVDRAVALSGILTAVVRGTLPVAPLHAIRAHSPGTGKSFLVDIASAIATGRLCPVIAAGKTEEETEKRLGALLRDGVAVVSIDNVNSELGGDMLCQMTERPLVRVRILGKSEAPEIEVKSTTFATGNNLTLVGDMTRRTVLCTLDAGMERPELRVFDFNPVERVLADRGTYVAAAMTIIRAYRAAGLPSVCGPIGSYEEWSEAVRAPLIWLGHADPVSSMETAREEDPELSAIRELFTHWQEHLSRSSGYTTNAIIKAACEKRAGTNYDYGVQEFVAPEFRDLLLRQAGDGGAVNSRRLGKWLSRIKGRVVDGHRIEMREDNSNGNRFSLSKIGERNDDPHF
ncbi:PriCT-2 domain-containing protein [Methylobacterium sp. V23]|uniref:PriCT-2 domain-containing protein n=1 Tax=Methylobacterium sp. V23 TaxID=2044878 RepID=UPI000CDA336B|nr:PriCT-2 domain-containing protein [Methylobacterium sp. V23]POR42700.1 hypothetical protein CRT23_11240 [Methylobacterium sp. V23]